MCKAQSLLSNPVWLLHTICLACGKWVWKCKLIAGIKVSMDTGKMTGCYLTNGVKYLKIFSSSLHHQILRKIFLVAGWVMNFRDEEESWQGKSRSKMRRKLIVKSDTSLRMKTKGQMKFGVSWTCWSVVMGCGEEDHIQVC